MEIVIDNWSGVFSNEQSFKLENEIILIDMINQLNGKNKTLVGLSLNDDTYLSIGGGNDGQYVVTGNQGINIYNLLSEDRIDRREQIEIVAGGQLGLYLLKYSINKNTAIKAALYFYKELVVEV